MKIKLRQMKWFLIGSIGILAAAIVLLWQSSAPAQIGAPRRFGAPVQFGAPAQFGSPVQFSGSDFRLNQLSSEVSALRLQVNQLQAQISGGRTAAPISPAPRIAPAPSTAANPAQFDRLATLVIELREQVRGIDDRLSTLEARFPRTAPQASPPASPQASPRTSPR